MQNNTQTKFLGTQTSLGAHELPEGKASDSLNWLTTPTKIELRRGYALLGTTEATGLGRISGLAVAKKFNNTQIPFRTDGKKIRYYDSALLEWVEIGVDLLGTAADGEDVSFAPYQPLPGSQLWLNSPHSGPKKIMVANPGSITDMYDSSKNYKAHISIQGSRAFNWGMDGKDKNGVRLSAIDNDEYTDYTQIVAEVLGIGNAVTLTFTGTLAFKAAGPKRTCFDITATDGVETFSDDQSGVLTGSLGGSGTINYTSGAISLTFATAPAAVNVTVTYRWEDPTATIGIANFVVPVSRVSGEPNVFRQDVGGELKNIFSLGNHKFCAHETTVYDLINTLDDTDSTNLIFRSKLGVPYLRAGVATAEGIYTVDTSDDTNPKFSITTYAENSTEIKPYPISQDLNLTDYRFDKAVVYEWNDYILFFCRHKDSTVNSTCFAYNKRFSSPYNRIWDRLDYYGSCAESYNGTLIVGDSITNNVYTLFSGFDDNSSLIENYYITNISKLGYNRQIKPRKFILEGEIGPDQAIRVYSSTNRGPFVEIRDPNDTAVNDTAVNDTAGAFIKGTGSYVDRSQRVTVGSQTLGSGELGGGGDGIEAYHYQRELPFGQDKFNEVQLKYVAIKIGYASITTRTFKDIRLKQAKIASRYR